MKGVVQSFWLCVKLDQANFGNKFVDYNEQEPQALVKLTLLEKLANGQFAGLQKANSEQLATIPHEFITDIGAQNTTQSNEVIPIVSQLQRIYPNNEFTPTGSPVISANSPKTNNGG